MTAVTVPGVTDVDSRAAAGRAFLRGLGVALLWWIPVAVAFLVWKDGLAGPAPNCDAGVWCVGDRLLGTLVAFVLVPTFLLDMVAGAVVLAAIENRLRSGVLAGTAIAWVGIAAGLAVAGTLAVRLH
jgi:hypothetical protein